MRVAIVGAGLSGLACAHELERHGIAPDVFDKRDRVGKMFTTVETMITSMHVVPGGDMFAFLRNELNLPVNPANHVTRYILHSEHSEATLYPVHRDYTTIRGPDERSLECQLARHIKARIRFDETPDIPSLRKEYDWVVVATGSPQWTKHYGLWSADTSWWVRGAVVKGEFNPGELHFFFQTRFAGTGYSMIAPLDERTASVGIALMESSEEELERYWTAFRNATGPAFWTEEVDQFKLECYEMGLPSGRVADNVAFIGNAGGFVESLGITGQFPCMASGVYLARQIATGNPEFDRFCAVWDKHYQRMWRIRRNINAWTDREMDRLVRYVRRGIGTAIYYLPIKPLDVAARVLNLLPFADDPSPRVGPE